MPDFRVTLTRGSSTRDLTPFILEMRWRLGMTRPYESVAAPAAGELLLDNRDQSNSPELDADGLLAPGTAIQIECEYDGWQPLFTGVVASAVPDMGEYGRRHTVLRFEGADAALARVTVRTAVLANVRAGEALGTILDTPPLDAISHDLDAGASLFAYVGDQWGDGLSAEAAVRQLVEAERGRFYLTRGGVLAFRSRHFGLTGGAPDLTVTAAESAQMSYGSGLVNHVRVGLRPRALGTPGSTVWTLANAQRLRPGIQLRLIAPLRDSQGRRAGAVDVVTPTAYIDYTANAAADGTGADATGDVSITVLALEGSAATLQIENGSADTIYLQPGARLRGTPLLGGLPATIEAADDDSIADYGQHSLSLRLPLVDSIDAAHDLAAWELERRAVPSGAVRTLVLSDRAGYAEGLPLTLFSRVRVVDPHTGHDRSYAIVAEEHSVTRGGLRHTIAFTLEPMPEAAYWTVGVSALGVDTRVAV